MYELLGSYMFRHQICHLQGARPVTLLNYISTITALASNCTYVIIIISAFFWLNYKYEILSYTISNLRDFKRS